jgi:hypothetical protein
MQHHNAAYDTAQKSRYKNERWTPAADALLGRSSHVKSLKTFTTDTACATSGFMWKRDIQI